MPTLVATCAPSPLEEETGTPSDRCDRGDVAELLMPGVRETTRHHRADALSREEAMLTRGSGEIKSQYEGQRTVVCLVQEGLGSKSSGFNHIKLSQIG
ncbi:hypothetical protein L596_022265 [Steinernema carpocapsae]|uniref:Uncharacterized protein n=1 Tax=Steinernema carpocapsae TaxID=34508 RepID=A0A4U5MLA1_STECR|nr:hypothetical protein L596_022265 [Steinernema carpocapsae]